MANVKPKNLLLRCYGYQSKKGNYVGVCLELNLSAEADSIEQLKRKMQKVIESYVDSVLDTDDKDSIAQLLGRHAPAWDYLVYYFIKLRILIKQFPGNFTFKETIPFHLAHNC